MQENQKISQEQLSTGADLANVIQMDTKITKKLKVRLVVDGEEHHIYCDSVDLDVKPTEVTVNIKLSPNVAVIDDTSKIPAESGVIVAAQHEKFFLAGDTKDEYLALSPFTDTKNRHVPAQDTKTTSRTISKVIESKMYNIQDVDCISQAVQDLVVTENELCNNNWKVVQIKELPQFIYDVENTDNFTLIETILIIQVAQINKDNENIEPKI